jgi:hypothetical protein
MGHNHTMPTIPNAPYRETTTRNETSPVQTTPFALDLLVVMAVGVALCVMAYWAQIVETTATHILGFPHVS